MREQFLFFIFIFCYFTFRFYFCIRAALHICIALKSPGDGSYRTTMMSSLQYDVMWCEWYRNGKNDTKKSLLDLLFCLVFFRRSCSFVWFFKNKTKKKKVFKMFSGIIALVGTDACQSTAIAFQFVSSIIIIIIMYII